MSSKVDKLVEAIRADDQSRAERESNDKWSPNEYRMLKHLLEKSHLHFCRYFLKAREGNRFLISPHHRVMARTLQRVLDGEITRLIVNVPPGYTKTEMAVINFIARGLALNPSSKFIHISYADSLALMNSSATREVITSEEYRKLWPMELKTDSQSKKAWYNEEGGGMLAVASGGTITGFRAGRLTGGFSGAIVVDDPIKPDDAFSDTIRQQVNRRFTNTFKSRVAHEKVPVIVIMQRIHEDDPTGFLLRGGTGEKWHHLKLPVDILAEDDLADYPEEFTHGIPIDFDLDDGPLWPVKHKREDIDLMKDADPYTFSAQYMQEPTPLGGGLFKEEWWQYYKADSIVFDYRIITGDTAMKTKEHNDFSVFQCWGLKDGNAYLIDQVRGKWEAPELRMNALAFWLKHFGNTPSATANKLREMCIEDKASGTGLIQDLKRETKPPIPVVAIQREKDKVTRAMNVVPYFAGGRVFIPESKHFLSDFRDEFRKFSATMTHKHDDQVDPAIDAIERLLRPAKKTGGAF